jgi:hypothetical protein
MAPRGLDLLFWRIKCGDLIQEGRVGRIKFFVFAEVDLAIEAFVEVEAFSKSSVLGEAFEARLVEDNDLIEIVLELHVAVVLARTEVHSSKQAHRVVLLALLINFAERVVGVVALEAVRGFGLRKPGS